VRELKRALNDAIILCKLRNSKIIQIHDLPTIKKDLYTMSSDDDSEKIKISELSSKPEIPPHSFFFNPWEIKKEEPSILMKNEDSEMLRQMLDSINSSISIGLRGIQSALDKFSHSESKIHPTKRIDFVNTIPKEYEKLFYEHWVKENCGPTKLSDLFNGRINEKTASANLIKAKKRLNESQGENSNKREDFP
jgi:hypothetical protein